MTRTSFLVTGASGFVGRRLTETLRAGGAEVIGVDLRPSPRDEDTTRHGAASNQHPGVDHVVDVRDEAALAELMPQRAVVFHLASVVGVRNVLAQPRETWSTSVEGSEAVCRVALERGARVVFTSSSEVYGDGRGRRLAEDAPLRIAGLPWPRAAYARGKLVAEQIVHDFCERGGDGRIARLFNASGPGQESGGGMVLPTFVEHALAGEDLPIVGDGADVRCFQHVDDCVAGLIALAGPRGRRGLVVNLGGREAVSIRELALRVRRVLAPELGVRRVTEEWRYGAAAGRTRHRVPDLRRAAELLGHRARRGLDTIILDLARSLDPSVSHDPRPVATLQVV